MMVWLLLGLGVLLLSGKGGGKALPDPTPSTAWRGDEIEAAACEIIADPPGGQFPEVFEVQWLLAKAAYPDHSWPLAPGLDLPDGTSAAKQELWNRLGEFAEKVVALEIECPTKWG